MTELNFAKWQTDINSWDKIAFADEVSAHLEKVNKTTFDRHAVALLVESINTFVVCTKDIDAHGLVVTHKNGVTGKNHHVAIRDKALINSLALMSELCLTPKRRKAEPEPLSELAAQFCKSPFSD